MQFRFLIKKNETSEDTSRRKVADSLWTSRCPRPFRNWHSIRITNRFY
ncbi:hypothetical protein PUN28_009171 [Cardiocondyla obscurior]|uniref:Uncharacterized protein n=1 Tax=Cardiocondyla obscurior TaxID=286306 RepID=A0AAW2FSZ8_9HYME